MSELSELRSRLTEMEALLAEADIVKTKLQLVNSLKEELLRSASLNEKLRLITDAVVSIFDADFARIWMIRPGDKCNSACIHAKIEDGPDACHHRDRCLHLLASSGRYTHTDGQVHGRVPFDCYKIGRIASGAEPRFMINDVCHDPRVHDQKWAKELGLVSFAGYRIFTGGVDPTGVLALFSKHPISSQDDSLLEGIANTAAHVFKTAIAVEALEREMLKFETLTENSPFATVMVERDGSFSYANPRFREMFGYDLNDVPNGREWLKMAYPDAEYRREVVSAWIEDSRGSLAGEPRPRVFTVKCRDGSKKIVHFRPVKLDSGQDLMTCQDITDLKKAEDQVRRNEARLKKMVDMLHYKASSVQDFRNYALQESIELTHSKIGYIFHYDEARKEFCLNTWSKTVMQECQIAEPQTVYQLDDTGIWGEAVRQRQAVVINDFHAPHPLKRGHPEGHAYLTRYLTIPVFAGDSVVAVVGVANKESDYNQADILELTLLMDSVWKAVDRLEAEEQLRKSEAILRTVLQSAPIGIGLVTSRILGWTNESLSVITGYTAEELSGKSARILYESDEEFERVGRVKYGQIKAGGAGSIETRWRSKDGSLVDILLSSAAVDPDDLSKGVVFSAFDISERKRSEKELKEAEERMRLLIESAPISIRIATQGKYSYVNKAFLRMFGYERRGDLEGLPVEELYVEEDRDLIKKRNANRAKGVEVDPHYHVTGIRKDGTHLDLDAWGSEILYQGQRSTLRFFVDVTESNLLRAQLLQAQKMEAIGTLAGGIAHDFNNLLQAILGYSDFMLQRKKEGEPDFADLQKIYKAGQRGADLVKSLLTLSRKVEAKYVPVNLNQEITQVQQLLTRTIPKTITIDLRLNAELDLISADQSQIGQVLMNMGVNARDAMPDGGALTIETANVELGKDYSRTHIEAMPGPYVLLTVSDTGHGMDRKTLSHMFEPFFSTKEVGKGTGLGLATVYGIVKQHYGHIMCYSEPGHGTTFKIYFPALKGKKDLLSSTDDIDMPRGTETILLVEDDEAIRELCESVLTDFGYEVITSCNGREALEIYQGEGERISLVILDLIMPEMDGRRCLEEILLLDPEACVVIVSGYSESGPANGLIKAGAKGFVEKPYNIKKLLTTIRNVLDGTSRGNLNEGSG